MDSVAKTAEELRSLGSHMAKARAKVKAGEVVSLEALESKVEALCRSAEDLSEDDDGCLHDSLAELLEEIERLNDAIRLSMAELTAQIGAAAD